MIAGLVLGAILIGGGSFYAGLKFGARRAGAFGAGAGQFGTRTGGVRMMNGGVATGQVLSVDATSMTIKLRDGSSKIVFFSNTTPVMKSTAGATTDVTTGVMVLVTGTANADGSLSAKTISINPASTTPVMMGGRDRSY